MIPVYDSFLEAMHHFDLHPDETCVVQRRWWFFWTKEAIVHCREQAMAFYGKTFEDL